MSYEEQPQSRNNAPNPEDSYIASSHDNDDEPF
jgi:hypothetical protein